MVIYSLLMFNPREQTAENVWEAKNKIDRR